MALGADEIVMHPYSNLGPVDPQIMEVKTDSAGNQSASRFGTEDLRNYIEFIRTDVGITDQEHMKTAFQLLVTQISPVKIGVAKRSQQLSLMLSEKMLSAHMQDTSKASSIVKTLTTSYHHGYSFGREEAESLGLKVIKPDTDTKELMWKIWLDFCTEMKCNKGFDPVAEIMENEQAKQQFLTYPVVALPANTSPQIGQVLVSDVAKQMAIQIVQQKSLIISCLTASVESVRRAAANNTKFVISFWRNVNMGTELNCHPYSEDWENITI